jgi:hypothetical protein
VDVPVLEDVEAVKVDGETVVPLVNSDVSQALTVRVAV